MLHVPAGANTFAQKQPTGATRPALAYGTAITPATGAKGGWTQMIASTAADTFGLLICINGSATSASSRNYAIDIGIGGAGSEIVLVPDLLGGNAGTYIDRTCWYFFPVFIPRGSRIAARAIGNVTTTFMIAAWTSQAAMNPSMVRKASFVEAIGISGAEGEPVTQGTTAEGAWTLIGTTVNRLWWWQVGMQVRSTDTAHQNNAMHVDLAVGDGTNFDVIISDTLFLTSSSEATNNPPLSVGVEWMVPAGSSIYARAQISGTSIDAITIAAYGAGG